MISLATARTLLEGMRPRSELVSFAAAMVNEGRDEFDVLDFIKKPWKWAHEYCAWVNHGRPSEGFLFPQTQDPARELDIDWQAAKDAFVIEQIGVKP